jgi:hypothetical protein
MNKILKKLHSFDTFIKFGLREKSTWIGILLLFGWVYHKEIDALITRVLTSNELATYLINGVATAIGLLAMAIKKK